MAASFGPADAGPETLAAVVERAAIRERAAGCESESEGGRTRVHLWGVLPFSWCGHLALHCHAAGVSILEVDARHVERGRWIASILLESHSPEARVSSRDFLAMARHRPGLVPMQPRIESLSFDLGEAEREPVARLRLRARDRLGLLAGVLQGILSCDLRPRELWIRTCEGWAEDWIVLESLAGTAPLPEALDALRRRLGDPNARPDQRRE
ncbi:MAG: hypothetical protein ACX98W_13000 [bacterium]